MNGISLFKKSFVIVFLITSCQATISTINYIKLGAFTGTVLAAGYALHEAQDRYLPLILPFRKSFIKVVEIDNQSDHDAAISVPAFTDPRPSALPYTNYIFVIKKNNYFKSSNGSSENHPFKHHPWHIQKALTNALVIYPYSDHSQFSIETSAGWFHLFCDKEKGALYSESSYYVGNESTVSLLLNDLDSSYQHHIKIIITEDGLLEVKLK